MPWNEPFTAASRSASGRMMLGLLPPSSSVTRLSVCAALAAISRPTAVEPVNAIFAMPGCSTIAAPVAPSPVNTFTTPSGKPASSTSRPRRIALRGVCSAGLRITVQPAASAGAIFHAAIRSGKFHGMICPHTPTGSSSAAAAAFTARSTSSGPACATSQIGSPVAGSIVSNVRPSAASTHSPPIRSLWGAAETNERAPSERASAVAVVMPGKLAVERAAQQVAQGPLLGPRQPRERLGRHGEPAPNLLAHTPALVGEGEELHAPVVVGGPSLHIAALLEPVGDPGDGRAVAAQEVRDGAHRRGLVERVE